MTRVARAVCAAQRWLTSIYGLDLDVRAEHFLVEPEAARRLLPDPSPRSGVVVVQEEGGAQLGLYLDARDQRDPGTIVEETSHLLCLAWHAARGLRVSRLLLELQGEVDRYAVARLSGGDALRHFVHFRWAGWMDAAARRRYATAHEIAHRYCRRLSRRYPERRDTPGLLRELRRFYRSAPESRLALR